MDRDEVARADAHRQVGGDQALARQPVARAELIGVVARLRMGLGDYGQALGLLDRQQRLVDTLGSGAPPSLHLEAATNRGRAQWLLGSAQACRDTLSPLLPLAHREQRQLPTQAAEFWSHRLERGKPLWEMVLLEGLPEGRWAIATKTHHCLVDGVGSLDIAYAMLDTTIEFNKSTCAGTLRT